MNPRIIRMFLAEKGASLDTVEIDLLAGENRQAPYTDKNPAGQTPMLELDDGSCLAETGAICEYLEEKSPSRPLIGTTPEERAETRMWWRRVEINICVPAVHAFYYAEGYDLFKDRVHCIPEAADGLKVKTQKALAWLDALLEDKQFLCGDRFTVADICLFTYLDLLRNAAQPINPEHKNVTAWFERVSARPSAEASVFPIQPMGLRG
jgi:glutathione S-transferase